MSRALLLVAVAPFVIAVSVLYSAEPGEVPNVRPADLGAVVVQEPEKPKERVEFIDIDRFLPAGLVKPVDRNFEREPLTNVLKAFGEITGLPVWPDAQTLTDAGVKMDATVVGQVEGIPAYIALNRLLRNVNGVELTWLIRDEQLFVTTAEAATVFTETVMFDLTPLLDLGYRAQSIVSSIHDASGGRWGDTDGEGGNMLVIGPTLMVRANFHVLNRVRCFLAALQMEAPRTRLFASRLDRRVQLALDAIFDCDFDAASLTQVATTITERLQIPVRFDSQVLADAGVMLDGQVTLNLSGRPLRFVLNRLLNNVNGVRLDNYVRDGELVITTDEDAREHDHVTVYQIPPEARSLSPMQIIQVILQGTSDDVRWADDDGEGGRYGIPRSETIVLRTSRRGMEEADQLVNGLFDAARQHPPATPAQPVTAETIETRYFWMPLAEAKDLQRVLPELVAPESWKELPGGARPIIETVTMPDRSGTMTPSPPGDASKAPNTGNTPSALVIRQTRGVQEQVRKFIAEVQGMPWLANGFDKRAWTSPSGQ